MDPDIAIVEQTSSFLKLNFKTTPRSFYLMFGIPFITLGGCGFILFMVVGLLLALLLAKQGMLRKVLPYLPGMLIPLLMIGLFLGLGIWLMRQGTKTVVVEAEIWTFDKTRQQFSIIHQYYDRKISNRWEQVAQTYPLPTSNAISEQSRIDELNHIVIAIGSEKIKSVGSGFSFSQTIQQIIQFLDS